MDAFFASVEQRDDPSLRGKPVLVGGTGSRGVVAAASYEARVFGCHSAQPMAVARRLCPHAIMVKGRYDAYREASDRVFEILGAFSPVVEPISIDEAFVDVTGSQRLLGEPEAIAAEIRRRVKAATQLTASVGVAPNKFLAKLASDLDKPDGLTVIRESEIERTLRPLEVERLWGVGPKAGAALHRLGIRTIGNVASWPEHVLVQRLGSFGAHISRLARGLDDRAVVPDHQAKSIGHEQTFPHDLTDPEHVRTILAGHAEQVGRRLRRHSLRAKTITLKIRYGNFETITRAVTLDAPTDSTRLLMSTAREIFDHWCNREGFKPIRLIGVTSSQLTRPEAQMDLFDDPDQRHQRTIDDVTDQIVKKLGRHAIRRAGATPLDRHDDDRYGPSAE
jgi:nucleotidyltransferase/DNA polymerase involved in DNA repair